MPIYGTNYRTIHSTHSVSDRAGNIEILCYVMIAVEKKKLH
jgi:hypothetical protein